jgi:predicted Fe-S protein YdhL (DUF1289 family)
MIESPCVEICEIDTKSGFCMGCKRTGFEIFNWINLNDEEKKQILLKLKNRSIYLNLKISGHKSSD